VTRQITLLGPQPRVKLQQSFRELGPETTVALVTAGWQEREVDDAELRELVGLPTVNLALHQRLSAGRTRPCPCSGRLAMTGTCACDDAPFGVGCAVS